MTGREEYSGPTAELAADVWFVEKYPDPASPARVLRAELMRGRSIYARPAVERRVDALVSQVRAAALAEAADAIDALIEEMAFREHVSGARARDLLRRMAAETTTPTSQEG